MILLDRPGREHLAKTVADSVSQKANAMAAIAGCARRTLKVAGFPLLARTRASWSRHALRIFGNNPRKTAAAVRKRPPHGLTTIPLATSIRLRHSRALSGPETDAGPPEHD